MLISKSREDRFIGFDFHVDDQEPQGTGYDTVLVRLGQFFMVDAVSLIKIGANEGDYTILAQWKNEGMTEGGVNTNDTLNPWRFPGLLAGKTIKKTGVVDTMAPLEGIFGNAPEAGSVGLIRIPIYISGKVGFCLCLDWSDSALTIDAEQHAQILEPAARNIQSVLQDGQVNNIVHNLSRRDRLTGLLNRPVILEHLTKSMARARRNKEMVAVIFLNIDQFKTINDALGYVNGDHLLKAVARRMNYMFRETDTVARIGSDCFVVVLENLFTFRHVTDSLQRFRDEFDAPFYLGGQNLHVRFSQGVATYPGETSVTAEELLLSAEIAMKHAKEGGGNQIRFFAPEMHTETKRRLGLEHDLYIALDNGEFEVHYQQQMCLKTQCIAGAESLIRWRHPKLGMLPPSEFLWIAEETGLIIPISEWILEEVCKVIAERTKKSSRSFQVAVNVSPRWFTHPEFPLFIEKTINRFDIPARCLEFEITEDVILSNTETTGPLLEQLKNLGVKITLDDFGTGYSSLSYLRNIPVDTLKIDRSFVSNLDSGKTDAAIVLALITLCQELGIEIVAEGVENNVQFSFLKQHQCHLAQGYYIARPEPYEAMSAKIDTV